MNVRRAVGEAIVAAQAVRAQRYMSIFVVSVVVSPIQNFPI